MDLTAAFPTHRPHRLAASSLLGFHQRAPPSSVLRIVVGPPFELDPFVLNPIELAPSKPDQSRLDRTPLVAFALVASAVAAFAASVGFATFVHSHSWGLATTLEVESSAVGTPCEASTSWSSLLGF